jgi:hypothetical protein
MMNDSGIYSEGIAYTNFTMDGFSLFFTAFKRLGYDIDGCDNPYDHAYINSIIEETMNFIDPTFSPLSFDDTWLRVWNNHYPYELYLRYYYQSDDISDSMEDDMKWFTNEYYQKNISGYYNSNNACQYPGFVYGLYKNIFNYNQSRPVVSSVTIIPENITNGTYSNEEYTFMREPVSTTDDFMNNTTLIVNHEHSGGHSFHEHGDQSSFQLFYKGIQLLIDPGYKGGLL